MTDAQGPNPNGPANQGAPSQIPSSVFSGQAVQAAPGLGQPNQAAPPTIIVQTAGSRWSRTMSWLGWTGFAICGLLLLSQMIALSDYFDTTEGLQEKFHSGAQFGGDKVAIITIAGVIMDGEGYVKQQIDRVSKDENVKAVVIRVNSPGGTVTGSDYMYHYLTRLREEKNIPIVVSMGSMATSGGYYVSMAVGDQEKSIFAEPTTTTGSIGVIIPHYDVSGLLARFDIKDDSIATHPRKQMLSMTRPISDDDRKLIESYINASFSRFKEIVKSGRPVYRDDPAKLDELATGEIFTANQALENGLIDEIGFIEQAIDRAIELAGLDKTEVRVMRYNRPVSLFSLSGLAQSRPSKFDVTALLEMSTPRAYYMWTSLPPIVPSGPIVPGKM